jgi:hypothetical protein
MGDCLYRILCGDLLCPRRVSIAYALWMASKPSLYSELISGPLYLPTVVNTLLFVGVGVGVNVKMFLALLLSGFSLRPRAGGSEPCWPSIFYLGC